MIRFYLTFRWYSQKWYSVIGFAFICKSFAFPKMLCKTFVHTKLVMEIIWDGWKSYISMLLQANAIERKSTEYNFKEGFFSF